MTERRQDGFSRRFLLKGAAAASCYGMVLSTFPPLAWGEKGHSIEHPMHKPGKYTDKGRCPNCGMGLNMWARTRHQFSNSEGEFTTCSIRCLADMSANSGEKPENVKVALYLEPEKMVPAKEASYVIGSAAAGTMTMKSKIGFGSQGAAKEFAADQGGKVATFQETLAAATKELPMSRPKIEAKRTKKGKIAQPGKEDRCTACGMYPARYPEFRSQLTTVDNKRHHFCSSKCLVNYQANPEQYDKGAGKTKSMWVTVYPDGDTEYATGLYYLVGSSILGPMGKEALAFRKKADAMKTADEKGGRVVRFNELTPSMVMGK